MLILITLAKRSQTKSNSASELPAGAPLVHNTLGHVGEVTWMGTVQQRKRNQSLKHIWFWLRSFGCWMQQRRPIKHANWLSRGESLDRGSSKGARLGTPRNRKLFFFWDGFSRAVVVMFEERIPGVITLLLHAGLYLCWCCYLLILAIFDLLFFRFEVGIERTLLAALLAILPMLKMSS